MLPFRMSEIYKLCIIVHLSKQKCSSKFVRLLHNSFFFFFLVFFQLFDFFVLFSNISPRNFAFHEALHKCIPSGKEESDGAKKRKKKEKGLIKALMAPS